MPRASVRPHSKLGTTMPIAWRRTLSLREVKSLAQGDTGLRFQN